MSSTRQLAAIMFTDIVGYTALMGRDSAKALELVRQNKDIQKPLVESHNGKWLKEMGDGIMVQFNSALDAVNCAIAIQSATRSVLDAQLRIGIHLGDVQVEETDVHGDGVNVASRLEALAEPGGIYISESVEKAIRGQNILTNDLGEFTLKNVDYPVKVYAVQGVGLPMPSAKKKGSSSGKARAVVISALAIVVVFALYFFGNTIANSSSSDMPSSEYDVAVMYLENMTDNEKFGDQLVHLIHTNLADQENLKVVSRQWIYDAMKDLSGESRNPTSGEATQIARKVGSKTMLVGQVIQQNESVQVQVELVDVASGKILGSRRVNGLMSSIFSLADEISRQINEPLQIESDYQVSEITTSNYEAFERYYAGLDDLWNYRFSEANKNFELAIQKDSTFALAWMQYALTKNIFSMMNVYNDLQPQVELVAKARSLSGNLPQKEKLYVEAMYAMYTGDQQSLLDFCQRIVAIDPDDRMYFALLGALQSREQLAIHDSLIAIFLERNPNSGFEVNSYAYRMAQAGNHKKARVALRKYIQLEPQNFNPWHSAWEISMIIGDKETALNYADTMAIKFPVDGRRWKGLSLFYANEPEEALEHYKDITSGIAHHSKEYLTMAHNSLILEGKFNDALSVIREQTSMPGFQDASNSLFLKMQSAKTLIWAGRYREAKSQLVAILEEVKNLPEDSYSPMNFLGHYFLGMVGAREGDVPELRRQKKVLDGMLATGEVDFRFDIYLALLDGEVLLLEGDFEQLKRRIENDYKEKIYSPLYGLRLEYLHLWKTGNYQEAIDLISPYYKHTAGGRWEYGGDQNFYASELAFSAYTIGRILEDAKRPSEAIGYYEQFLEQFRNSDPGIKEKEDAIARLQKLKNPSVRASS